MFLQIEWLRLICVNKEPGVFVSATANSAIVCALNRLPGGLVF